MIVRGIEGGAASTSRSRSCPSNIGRQCPPRSRGQIALELLFGKMGPLWQRMQVLDRSTTSAGRVPRRLPVFVRRFRGLASPHDGVGGRKKPCAAGRVERRKLTPLRPQHPLLTWIADSQPKRIPP